MLELQIQKDDIWVVEFSAQPKVIGACGCNIIVLSDNVESYDKDMLFGEKDIINYITADNDMFDILVALKVFTSKGQAAKNWKQSGKSIPTGWSQFIAGLHKPNRIAIYIWNPSAKASDFTDD